MRRNVAVNVAVWRNKNVVSNRNVSDDNGIDSDPNSIADNRCPFSLASVFLPDENSLMYVAVFSDDCFRIYGNVIRMLVLDENSIDKSFFKVYNNNNISFKRSEKTYVISFKRSE